jgi:hypothetical protein
MNQMQFSTGGSWDTTSLHNNGQEMAAAQLYVELHAGRDEDGEPRPGGVALGGEMTAFVRPQDDVHDELPIFPGRLELRFPHHEIAIENRHPDFDFPHTRVWHNGKEVTGNVVEVRVNVDAIENEVTAHITVYKRHWLASDEVATYNIV